MDWAPASVVRWLFDSEHGDSDRLISRWIFLRTLGLIYFSAFFSLVFQIRGLIGPQGILPANDYLEAVDRSLGHLARLWFAPTLLWLSSSSHMLLVLCWVGMLASLALVLNLWPRAMLMICLAISQMACCSKLDSSRFSLPLRVSARAGAQCVRQYAPVSSFCNGSGFASTSNRASQRSPAEIPSGAT